MSSCSKDYKKMEKAQIRTKEVSPKDMAKDIFADEQLPNEYYKFTLLENTSDASILFEVLLHVLMDGIMLLTNNLKKVNVEELNCSYINSLNMYLKKININVNTELIKAKPKTHYCKIMVQQLFILLEVPYKFYLNSERKYYSDLKQYYAIFENVDGNTYKINFSILT